MTDHHKKAASVKEDERKEIKRDRAPDFISRYANYTHLTGTLWDLRMVFGQSDPAAPENVIPIHTSMTLSWPQAKALSYFLKLHLAGYEYDNGRIKIPAGIIPVVSESATSIHGIYQEFIAENPEAAPPSEE